MVDLNIMIHENEPSKIDSLKYEGLDKISRELKAHYLDEQRLKTSDIFSVERLIDERNRTISFFKEEGYAFFHQINDFYSAVKSNSLFLCRNS